MCIRDRRRLISGLTRTASQAGSSSGAGSVGYLSAAVGSFVGLVLVTLVAGLSRERLPLWCGLVGVATFVGSYYGAFNAAPYLFKTESILYMAAAFCATMIGFLAAAAADLLFASGGVAEDYDEVEDEVPATTSGM